jgi:hypothetical protein
VPRAQLQLLSGSSSWQAAVMQLLLLAAVQQQQQQGLAQVPGRGLAWRQCAALSGCLASLVLGLAWLVALKLPLLQLLGFGG